MLSGLKSKNIIRTSGLAVVNEKIFTGSIGNISTDLLSQIITKIIKWLIS